MEERFPKMLNEVGFFLLLLGTALIAAGIIWSILRKTERSQAMIEGGGVVFIGPIPIIFGTSFKLTIIVMILAIIIMLLSIFFYGI